MRNTGLHLAVAVLTALAACSAHAGDKAFGEYLSAECVACHQLTGRYDGIPPIVGLPDPTFIQIMTEYRARKRPNAVMQTFAARLSDEEIAALAAYFGSITSQPTMQ